MNDKRNCKHEQQKGISASKLMSMTPEDIEDSVCADEAASRTNDSNHECICNKKTKEYHGRCSELLVTKSEGFTIFFILLMALCVFTLVMQKTIVDKNDDVLSQMSQLNAQIEVLKAEMANLEDKIDAYESEENSKPINITIDLNGIDYTYDPDTGGLTAQNPDDLTSNPDFDTRPFLGVGFNEVNDGVENQIGLKVHYVYQKSPAEKAGIKVGDILMAIDGIRIDTWNDLNAVMSTLAANDTIEIQYATSSESGVNIVTASTVLTYRGNYVLSEQD